MDHNDLVEAARQWLFNRQRCAVVITELAVGSEMPDAIGWKGGGTTLIECKASLSDLRADGGKPARRHPEIGVGTIRYHLVPPALEAEAVRLAEAMGWGVLVCEGMARRYWKVRRLAIPVPRPKHAASWREAAALVSALRRIADSDRPVQGVSVRYYDNDLGGPPPRGTLGVRRPDG